MPITVLVTADSESSYLSPLKNVPEGVKLIATNDRDSAFRAAPEIDVLVSGDFRHPALFLEVFPRATRLKWAHILAAGVESVLTPEMKQSSVPLTNGRGVFARPLGEWAIGAMLCFSYEFRRIIDSQRAKIWERYEHQELYGSTVAILGYGAIGRAVGERASAFGMRVLTSRRSEPGDLNAMLAECDYLVITAPATPETRGLIGRAQLARMKPSAVVINVGRGAIIDELALVDALQTGKIRGAALDVFAAEPLPAGHPFWTMDNVLLSPHSADNLPNSRELAVEFFVENLKRYCNGEPLCNVVNKNAGY
jgi:phosphoglycerate dehydrogenase-like enzyme